MKPPEGGLQILRREEGFNTPYIPGVIGEGYPSMEKIQRKQRKNSDFFGTLIFDKNVFFLAHNFF